MSKRIGDLDLATIAAASDNIEISLAGSAGSRKITVTTLLVSLLGIFGYYGIQSGEDATTVVSKQYKWGHVKRYGAVIDGTTNDTLAIQRAINSGARVIAPAGTYKVVPATDVTDEAGATKVCFTMRSNLTVDAEPGAHFRIGDSVSTTAAPIRMYMFFSSSVLSNIRFKHLAMDMNGANNLMSVAGNDNTRNQAQIGFSGTPGGVAASGTDVLLDDCQFLNSPGTNCIVMAQSNTVGITLGKRWTIRNCLFKDNGLNVTDITNIYGFADDVLVTGCTLTQEAVSMVGLGCPYEVHGANHRYVHNNVKNMNKGAWVSSNLSTPCTNIVIALNTFLVRSVGVEFDRSSSSASAISDVDIAENMITLDDVDTGVQKAAISISTKYAVTDIKVSGNVAKKTGTVTNSAFCVISPAVGAVSKMDRITISGSNVATGFVGGVIVVCGESVGVGRITVNGAVFNDLVAGGGSTATGLGVVVTSGAADSINFTNNRVNGSTYGTYLSGEITRYNQKGNSYQSCTTNYDESAATITTRSGDFQKVGYTPTFPIGMTSLGNGTVSGRWSMQDDLVTVSVLFTKGSTTTLSGAAIQFSIPFAAVNLPENYVGEWYLNRGGTYYGGTAEITGGGTNINMFVNAASNLTNTSPGTIGTGDTLGVQLTYLRA